MENEALNRNFGVNGEFDRSRLVNEFKLVKKLDPARPIIMTTSNVFGLPLGQPRPNKFGFSIYKTQYHGGYKASPLPPIYFKLRAWLVNILTGKPVFIHELQAEPWGPQGVIDMTINEQFKSMNPVLFKTMISFSLETGLSPIYLWGAEWWYWLKSTKKDNSMWEAAKQIVES